MILESLEKSSGRVVEMNYDVVNEVSGSMYGSVSEGSGSVYGSVSSRVSYLSDLVLVSDAGERVKFRRLKTREKICLVGDSLEFEYFNTGMVVLKNLDSGLKFVLSEGRDWVSDMFSYYGRRGVLEKSRSWVKYISFLFVLLLVLCWNVRSGMLGVYDIDGDGYLALEDGGWDCDDNNDRVSPGRVEIPGNGIDDDCREGDAMRRDVVNRAMMPLNPIVDSKEDSYKKRSVTSVINLKMFFVVFGVVLVWCLCLMVVYWRRDDYVYGLMYADNMLRYR